jgi:hypothetical protein
MKTKSTIEPLESRIAPSVVFGLRSTNELITFDSDAPTEILTTKTITGLSDFLVAIDVRPATGELYALGSASRLYTINPKTAVATQVGSNGAFTLNGVNFGFDFNPVVDIIRVTSDTGQNLRLNPDTGVLFATDTSIAYAAGDPFFGGSASVVGAAYTNSYAGATDTTLFDIDYSQDALAIQSPANNGMLNTVGSLGLNADNNTGFDIAAGSTTGLASLFVDPGTGLFAGLYSINLTTGAATLIDKIGDGSFVTDIAIVPGNLKLPKATKATFRDVDGDTVTVKVTEGTLEAADFTLLPLSADGGAQLETLNLTDAGFAGATVTITVTKAATGDGQVNIGRINAGTNDLGTVSIPGDLGAIDAGSSTGRAIKSLSVRSMGAYGLSTHGGTGMLESDINGDLGSLKVTGDVREAYLNVTGTIGPVTIGGSLIGGATVLSGAIVSGGDMGAVKIGHDVQGSLGPSSGHIRSGGKLASVKIGGSLIGGADSFSGKIFSTGDMGAVKIGHDVQGGAEFQTGFISSGGKLASVKIGGSLIGGSNFQDGGIESAGNLGPVKIVHDVLGGSGDSCGSVVSSGELASVKIGGSLIGGSGGLSGAIFSSGNLGAVKIGHDVHGGTGGSSGFINSTGKIASVTIGGSLIGSARAGESIANTGAIVSVLDMGAVKIGGDLAGASVTGMEAVDKSAYIQSGGRIASVTIGGSIFAGSDNSTSGPGLTDNASIRAHDDIGALTVKSSIIGNDTQFVFITARGQAAPTATKDAAFGKITISGRVEEARIRAGFDTDLSATNGNAQIGAVSVGGDWIASILSAGVKAGADNKFGTDDDEVINNATDALIAKIAGIKIKGAVVGTDPTVSNTDHFGFIAQQIGSFKSLGFTAHLTSATDPATELSPTTADITVREV